VRDDYLFRRGRLSSALEQQLVKMRKAINAEPEESLPHVDIPEWAAALAHHFAVDCPELQTDDVWMEEPKQTDVDVSSHHARYFSDPDSPRTLAGERITIHIPFEGDKGVFSLGPSSFTTVWPQGEVRDDEILISVEYLCGQEPPVQGALNQFIDLTSKYLGWCQEEIDAFNARLEQDAVGAIESRRALVTQRNEQLAQTGIPIRKPGQSSKTTYVADALVLRPAPSVPKTRADDKAPRLEPVLSEQRFEHILELIRKQGLHIEQHPQTYLKMDEEERRNVILQGLSLVYDGFTAETHSRAGHTDIICRVDGRNVFICECKFWAGQKGFTETIDQLFGYGGWRDTKLSIVMFVREKNLTEIVTKARAALKTHPQFVGWKAAASDTELRATMHWEGDEKRLADLNVLLVHTPTSVP
jgi:hypothetical protein